MLDWFSHSAAIAAAAIAAAGLGQTIAGCLAVRRFTAAPPPPAGPRPPISVLKPLHGDEPLLEAALATICTQDYPAFQLVCGVGTEDDGAVAVVRRLAARFPAADIALVIDPRVHGVNGKVSNLMNMLPHARHDLLVIADSDVHAPPGYLKAVADALAAPGTGLATAVYAGLAADGGRAARLGATAITHTFLPGALIARRLGRQDCLGATMALRRETLVAVGGLRALVNHLADDNLLGRLVRARGLAVAVAPTVVSATVPETGLPPLYRHELRWARTIRRLEPAAFAASAIQYPLAWAALAVACAHATPWAVVGFALAWALRATAAGGIDAALGLAHPGLATPAPIWLLPARDLLSLAILAASYGGDEVEWRGEVLHTALDKPDAAPGRAVGAPLEGPSR